MKKDRSKKQEARRKNHEVPTPYELNGMTEFSIVEIRFLDHLKKVGCPVCSASDEAVRFFFDSLFYENINDGEVRKSFEANDGFCSFHTKMAQKLGDPMGMSILFASLLSKVFHGGIEGGSGKCRCCEIRDEAAERGAESVKTFLDNGTLFENIDKHTLFCRKHFERVKTKLDDQMQNKIENFQVERLESIYRNLIEIVRKMDYTSATKDFTEDEMFSLNSVVKYFSTFEELSV